MTYDAKSFLLDNQRIWIVAGEIHYFRHPREEWRQVLLRAKRAGLNTISTYVAWNFHEEKEGVVDFSGDKDLAAYIDLIGEMGMYAMLRPGPYICSEWDGGGIPAWLLNRPVKRFREDDPIYMAAVENWFDKLIPIISQRQVTKGGPVITIQNENEYPGGWDASMRRYIEKINGIFKKHGIEVPVMACNVHGATHTTVKINDSTDEKDQLILSDMILTYNHHAIVEPIYDLKKKQPDKPLIISEFWSGTPVYWGQHLSQGTDDKWPHQLVQAKAAYEFTSTGTQLVYYMFEGGTNFGFFGGNNIATSYASHYPVGEGGKLTEKYYAVRPANLFANSFGDFMAESTEMPDKAGLKCSDGARLVVRECSKGKLAFLSVPDRRKEISLFLPDGRNLEVHLGDVAAAVLPVGLEVFEGTKIDYSNLTLLSKNDSKKLLILYGAAGSQGVIAINGGELEVPVQRRRVEHRKVGEITLVIADEEMAQRCWIDDDAVIFGPDFVGERLSVGGYDIKISDAVPEVVYFDKKGNPVRKRFNYAAKNETAPVLRSWNMTLSDELDANRLEGWKPLDAPCCHEKLDVVQGYVWYAAELYSEEDRIENLLLPNTPNRVSVFVNNTFCGVHAERRSVRMRDEYRHPADWAFEEVPVRLKKGKNSFVFLSDDLGHNYDVPVAVGIQGPVFAGSRRIETECFREIPPEPVSKDAFNFLYSRLYREPNPLPALEFELPLEEGQLGFITLHGAHAWVTVNGRDVLPMTYPESPWTMFAQIKRWITFKLPEAVPGTKYTVRIQYVGNLPQAVKENLTVYIVPKSGQLTNWRWKPWGVENAAFSSEVVKMAEDEDNNPVVLLPAGGNVMRKGRLLTPAWFETYFDMPEGERPVYLKIGELQKGQIFMNGHNVGRFWKSGGTQELYYLPRAWMKETNRLVIFEELGHYPQNTTLVFGESGQWSGIPLSLK